MGACESAFCQELGLVHLLGGFHERRILEVGVLGTVDVGHGFLAELVDVWTVDAVFADKEHPFPDLSIGGGSCFRSLCIVRPLQCLG
ncbi:hypothetical protein D9M69_651420 [compost metagenome]